MATLASLRADLRGLAGLSKVTEAEADALLNEGYKEMCVRAEWTRANLSIGPTVADQAAYALPAAVHRPLRLTVNGYPFHASDENEVARIDAGDLRLRSRGLYWISFDASGVEKVSIYPTPGSASAGQAIILTAVVLPATLTASDTPAIPEDFHSGIRDYAASVIYGYTEDNPELRTFHYNEFERQLNRLRALRMARAGRGGVRMRIEGATA